VLDERRGEQLDEHLVHFRVVQLLKLLDLLVEPGDGLGGRDCTPDASTRMTIAGRPPVSAAGGL